MPKAITLNLPLQVATVTNPSGDGETLQVAIGPETFSVSLSRMLGIGSGAIEDQDLMLFQFLIRLFQLGTDVNSMPAILGALSGASYRWHT